MEYSVALADFTFWKSAKDVSTSIGKRSNAQSSCVQKARDWIHVADAKNFHVLSTTARIKCMQRRSCLTGKSRKPCARIKEVHSAIGKMTRPSKQSHGRWSSADQESVYHDMTPGLMYSNFAYTWVRS